MKSRTNLLIACLLLFSNLLLADAVTIFAGESILIGHEHVEGYTYIWSSEPGLDSYTSAETMATPTETTTYICTSILGEGGESFSCGSQYEITVYVVPDIAIFVNGALFDDTEIDDGVEFTIKVEPTDYANFTQETFENIDFTITITPTETPNFPPNPSGTTEMNILSEGLNGSGFYEYTIENALWYENLATSPPECRESQYNVKVIANSSNGKTKEAEKTFIVTTNNFAAGVIINKSFSSTNPPTLEDVPFFEGMPHIKLQEDPENPDGCIYTGMDNINTGDGIPLSPLERNLTAFYLINFLPENSQFYDMVIAEEVFHTEQILGIAPPSAKAFIYGGSDGITSFPELFRVEEVMQKAEEAIYVEYGISLPVSYPASFPISMAAMQEKFEMAITEAGEDLGVMNKDEITALGSLEQCSSERTAKEGIAPNFNNDIFFLDMPCAYPVCD